MKLMGTSGLTPLTLAISSSALLLFQPLKYMWAGPFAASREIEPAPRPAVPGDQLVDCRKEDMTNVPPVMKKTRPARFGMSVGLKLGGDIVNNACCW